MFKYPPNNVFILIKSQGWSLTTVLIRFKWKLILCPICDSGVFTFPATSGDCPYSQICHIWLFNPVKWSTGPLALFTNLMQEAMWNPNFAFPLVVTETPSSEILVAVLAEHTGESRIYWGQWHNYLFVHNFVLGRNTAYLKGLRMLNRQHGQLNLRKGTGRFSRLWFGL